MSDIVERRERGMGRGRGEEESRRKEGEEERRNLREKGVGRKGEWRMRVDEEDMRQWSYRLQ